MALIEELNKQGSFLFKWRSYVPVIFLLFSLLFLPNYRYVGKTYHSHLWFELVCILVSFFGQWIRFMTIGYTPARTSGRNTKEQVADLVNMTGIYSLIRHPLYVGNFFMFLGPILLLNNVLLSLLFIIVYWFYYERIMFTEESFLRNKFGNDYLEWANRTPTIIPDFKNYTKNKLAFSFKNIIKREYPGVFTVFLVFTGFDLAIIYFNEPNLYKNSILDLIRPVHIYFFGFGLLYYIVVRIIAKSTKWLEVDGR